MCNWSVGIQQAIQYIESNLTEKLEIDEIAKKAYVSSFHFQRIFHVLCGISIGEYIRNRRLTLAAQELSATDAKVIDVALRYGYDSPDSFTKAFTRFHGMSPSSAKKNGVALRSFAPLKIKLTLEGGTMLAYKIVEKPAFTVMGKAKTFSYDTAYEKIPQFWTENMQNGGNQIVCGMYGVCLNSDKDGFEYLIADNYIPWNEVPEGCVTRTIPAGTWAVFSCRGALPKALQDLNTRIWEEWMPNCKGYALAGNYSIEMYTPPCENPEESYQEIWVPIKKVEQ